MGMKINRPLSGKSPPDTRRVTMADSRLVLRPPAKMNRRWRRNGLLRRLSKASRFQLPRLGMSHLSESGDTHSPPPRLQVAARRRSEAWRRRLAWRGLALLAFLLHARPASANLPLFDVTAKMRILLVPSDVPVGTVIYRLRATDSDFDYPLHFDTHGTSLASPAGPPAVRVRPPPNGIRLRGRRKTDRPPGTERAKMESRAREQRAVLVTLEVRLKVCVPS
jgi:hypothetical protein